MLAAAPLMLSLVAPPAAADVVLEASVANVSSPQYRAGNIRTRIELSAAGLAGEIRIERIELLASAQQVEDVRLVCGHIRPTSVALYCDAATVTASLPYVGQQTAAGSFVYQRASGSVTFDLDGIEMAGGALALRGRSTDDGLRICFDGKELELERLLELAAEFTPAFAAYSGAGRLAVQGRFESAGTDDMLLELDATLDGVAIANDAGTLAADGLDGRLGLLLRPAGGHTRFTLDIDAHAGEAYLEPVYASFAEHALTLRAADVGTTDFERFEVPRFELVQASLLDLSGSATLVLPPGDDRPGRISAEIELSDTSVSTLYSSLLQVAFAGTILGNLETDGRVSGRVEIEDNRPASAALELDGVILDDTRGRFALYGLDGHVDWPGSARADAGSSRLSWDSATAYSIIVSGGSAEFALGDADVELLELLSLETMGGALHINRLALTNYGSDDARGILDAELEPVQLGQLTGAFGWPAFSGQLSGRLPLLTLEGNTLTVGGSLTASAFDGDIEISNLEVEQPFGRVPRLEADIRLRNLDLERMTDAFSFGLIQGRLSGDVTGLRMIGWRTDALDMHFYTPPGDDSRHRISQRAVENLASVGGGGGAGALSSGLLRFFEVFAYDRIGLRCILVDGTCTMSGAGPAGDSAFGEGYYIVKGSGLPRIDVVGYRREVSWSRLLRQLEEITRRPAPTVR